MLTPSPTPTCYCRHPNVLCIQLNVVVDYDPCVADGPAAGPAAAPAGSHAAQLFAECRQAIVRGCLCRLHLRKHG